MNSGPDLRVRRSLELLGTLKQTAARFAKREEVLAKELTTRRYASNRATQEAVAAKEANYSAQLKQVEDYFGAEAQRIQKYTSEARLERITRYSSTRLRNLPRLAQEAKGKWQGDLQMRNYRAERKREMAADIVEADADYHAGFSAKLEEHWKTLLALERRARTAFRGYLSFRLMLRKRRPVPLGEDASLTQMLQEVGGHLETADRQLHEFQDFSRCPAFSATRPWSSVLAVLTVAVAGVLYWQLGKSRPGLIPP